MRKSWIKYKTIIFHESFKTLKSLGNEVPEIQGEINSSKKRYLGQHMDEERLDAIQVGKKSEEEKHS